MQRDILLLTEMIGAAEQAHQLTAGISTGHRCDPGLGRTSHRGQGPTVTYRAELSGRALKQMHGLPSPAFDSTVPCRPGAYHAAWPRGIS